MIDTIIQIERIFSKEGGSVILQPIVDDIIRTNNGFNVLEMLTISCEYENISAQSSYLSIISECAKIFLPDIGNVANLRSYFAGESVYYYLEFLLACSNHTFNPEYISGIYLDESDIAFPSLSKLKILESRAFADGN